MSLLIDLIRIGRVPGKDDLVQGIHQVVGRGTAAVGGLLHGAIPTRGSYAKALEDRFGRRAAVADIPYNHVLPNQICETEAHSSSFLLFNLFVSTEVATFLSLLNY